ncbi:ThuA domain-containing protein [Roseateles cellulosilyticus]|uniref:ThuA domain-containing protein n=1 Tax=Pelomonas cellulosilytica TaxID=2906762 RepID=A0ABS8Y1V1_9BURK|nr:ThuA domain-containing protein [Pelomonas sp. P8]MCE4557082.1 ThuA domain-containing protein [Pelomonas sp. P8]
MTQAIHVTWRSRLAQALLAVAAAQASAAPVTDCPLRDAPFSVDLPLLDVLQSPRAMTALAAEWPGVRALPAWMAGTKPPSLSAVMTLRSIAAGQDMPPLARLDAVLGALPVDDSDRAARCARYDDELPQGVVPAGSPRLLVFEKVNGFLHAEAIPAARAALRDLARRRGWSVTVTDKGGAMTPAYLRQFDVVVWNNVSGDVLTLPQRAAFQTYMEGGGGFVGLHGAGGDGTVWWDWYADTLLGSRFKGHPMNPQFQDAHVVVEAGAHPVVAGLGDGWTMKDEWYSFTANPREAGARVLATLDEKTYSPGDLAMGDDHPIAWTRCVGRGRAFYSAIGHRAESYADPSYLKLIEQATTWAAGRGGPACEP